MLLFGKEQSFSGSLLTENIDREPILKAEASSNDNNINVVTIKKELLATKTFLRIMVMY